MLPIVHEDQGKRNRSSVSPCASKEATEIRGIDSCANDSVDFTQSWSKVYDLRIILVLFVDSHCVIDVSGIS